MQQDDSQQHDALACELHGTALQHFKGMNPDPRVIMLDFRNNDIESFYGFPTLPSVQCCRFEFNRIHSFLGMSYQPQLQVLTLCGNPVCDVPNYRILAMLACGEALREIDGEIVTADERTVFTALGGSSGTMAQLVSLGWTELDLGSEDPAWILEKCKSNFVRVSQTVDEARSFAAIAPQSADLVPLSATPFDHPEQQQQQQPYRSVLSPPRAVTRHGLEPTMPRRRSPQAEHTALHEKLYWDQMAAAEALAVAELKLESGASTTASSADDRNKRAAAASSIYAPSLSAAAAQNDRYQQQQSAAAPDYNLTKNDVNSILRQHQPHFDWNKTDSNSNNQSGGAAFAVTQAMMQTRAEQVFANVKLSEKDKKSTPALQQARAYAQAYQNVAGVAPLSTFIATATATTANNNNNNNSNHNGHVSPSPRAASMAGSGPSPDSAFASSSSPALGSRVPGAQFTLSRSDIVCMDAVEMSSFDVSAQFQPPKTGMLQVVRATLRIVFSFPSSGGHQQEEQPQPMLIVLDDVGSLVASFALAVSSPARPQSLWIHKGGRKGEAPAVALCSEQDGGVVDVVIMPTAGTPHAEAKSHALHKVLVHAMAEHSSSSADADAAPRTTSAAPAAAAPAAGTTSRVHAVATSGATSGKASVQTASPAETISTSVTPAAFAAGSGKASAPVPTSSALAAGGTASSPAPTRPSTNNQDEEL